MFFNRLLLATYSPSIEAAAVEFDQFSVRDGGVLLSAEEVNPTRPIESCVIFSRDVVQILHWKSDDQACKIGQSSIGLVS